MKKLLISLALLFTTISCIVPSAMATEQSIDVLPTMNWTSSAPNRIWVGTFQIVWNEFMDNIVKKPIKFVDYNSQVAKALNKQNFKKKNINENSYYTKYGSVSPELKAEIEKGIKEKFDETSDILDTMDWTASPDKILVYAMLKKDFKFLKAFDKLGEGPFAQNQTPVEYFGINSDSNKKLDKNLKVLFYNNENDFAVKLYTQDDDMVLLYRTNDDVTFDKYFKDIEKKANKYKGEKNFQKDDELKIPNISLYKEASFNDVEGHQIKGTNLQIDRTIETVDFKMNNEGVELKSEAAIIARMTALLPEVNRRFYFTDNFVLFLIEKGQKVPYYAMKVNDVETLNNTAKAE